MPKKSKGVKSAIGVVIDNLKLNLEAKSPEIEPKIKKAKRGEKKSQPDQALICSIFTILKT
ncbi:hypothetical protein JIY74_35765 [Vibrio harveyi]|nr:hypothetical protein [Vibrio harveyi]